MGLLSFSSGRHNPVLQKDEIEKAVELESHFAQITRAFESESLQNRNEAAFSESTPAIMVCFPNSLARAIKVVSRFVPTPLPRASERMCTVPSTVNR